MTTNILNSSFSRTGTRLIVFMALMLTLISHVTSAAAAAVPVELCAKPGFVTMPDGVIVTFWGYGIPTTPGDCSTATASLPGPSIDVNQGDVVTVNLHNNLGEASAILFQGQNMVPDTTGAAAGGTTIYTFTATNPGTFLYEAGLLSNAEHQSAMGLYGALIVRPATAGQAYDNAATAFIDEATLVLSEIDPALNNSATPSNFDMRNYAPRYFLINGKAYPNTDPIPSAAGNKVLLRYVNAGVQQHSMAVLGLRQNFVAKDGSLLPTLSHNVAAESLAPGQTGDAIATIPAAATTTSKFAVYDGSLILRNSNTAGFGGMLTFITAGAGSTVTGPTTSSVALSPNLTNGSFAVALSASINSASSTVTAAEYFIDATGTAGTGTPMGGTFGSATVAVNATVSTMQLLALASGNHTIYVHGQDATNAWGAFSSAILKLDKAGPATSGLTLTPNPSNGSVSVALSATGNDSATGGSNVTAAEYTIDGGTAVAMTLGGAASPTRSLSATIAGATVNVLTPGSHTVSIRSQDALGNWGNSATISLIVDKTGPVISGVVTANKNPNNGALPLNASQPVVRVTATLMDALSKVVAAEGFIDTVGANGTGFSFVPSDGAFNSLTETGYGDIPLTTINALSTGNHTIYVHGKDATGNWGVTATTVLVIDKTAPTFTGISLAPNPTNGAASVTLTVNGAADTGGAGVAGGEYWINPPTTTAPAPGSGTQFSGLTANIPVGSLAIGTYTVSARIRDAAFNWSTGTNGIRTATLTVVPDAIFSNGFETGTTPWGWTSASTTNTNRLNIQTTAPLIGTRSLQAQGNNTNYVQYDFGTVANPSSGTFDARFYFNPNGNTGTNQDIFVARTSGGTTAFRVRYRMNSGQSQVQIQVGTSTANTTWTNLTNSASNRIEVVWQAVGSGGPNPGTLVLHVNGVSSQTLTTTSTNIVGQVRLGSVTSGGNSTLEYFDAFASKRTVSPLIGP